MILGKQALIRRIEAVAGPEVPKAVMTQWGMLAVRYAKELVHRKTGNLARTIHSRTDGTNKAYLEASANYAGFLEFGTKPHTIVPVRARVLAWGGARRLSGSLRSGSAPTNFATVVHHPGTSPYPFIRPGAERALKEVGVDAIIVVWNEAA